jgi:SutA RNAP-binding domain
VKLPPTKAEIRAQLEQETSKFLREGGNVNEIPQGQSGKEAGQAPIFLNRRLFDEKPTPRTPVPDVVATIEERRKALLKRSPKPKRTRLPRSRLKTIYDDFGEPLRTVWVEE